MSYNMSLIANEKEGKTICESEVRFQTKSTYSETDERILVDWISRIVGTKPKETGQYGFYEWLKDGQVLYQLMNYVKPGAYSAHLPCKSKLAAKRAMLERENVNYFINAVSLYGVPSKHLFKISYLYDQENMHQVQSTLLFFKAHYEKQKRR